MTEGADYSRGGIPTAAQLKAAGKNFVVRYVVGDLSPQGRGIRADEFKELTAGGIDVAAVWEGQESRIVAGRAAGQADARDAETHLANAGMPATMPVYFACDFDAAPSDQPAIDAYLRGCADVMGAARVGIYGGYHIIKRCHENGSAQWFWQTSAWSGGMVYEHANLYQYAYDKFIAGVNVDWCRALTPAFGQARSFMGHPAPTVPWATSDTGTHKIGDTLCLAWLGELTAIKDVPVRATATRSGPVIATVKQGQHATGRGSTRNKGGKYYFVDLGEKGVGRAAMAGFAERYPVL